ncbi:lymphocyte antigen 6G-like isoform X2 [Thunnus albacares]|uniref:lymphocyte antigen 6G-like isoform X2 n=1 Tax=Thunnus albacares TaxID=8236 RepID=UPI001CF70558|nr:lymphocyte antigen 6G-like isoform X2 [Thunnus albacares]
MQLYGALILFLTLSTAHGLKCYTCEKAEPKSCTKDVVCDDKSHRCFSKNETGLITMGCHNSDACASPMSCCEGDLCNNAIPTGPSVILLLVSSAIITLFL